jgi:hypothetical protein
MQANGSRWERPDAPLGTLVFRAGLLSKEKLENALVEGRRTGKRLGEVLLSKGWIDEKDLARLLAGQRSLPFVSLRGRGFDPDAARLISEDVCREHNAVAVEDTGVRVVVAVADPTDDDAMRIVQKELGREVELVVSTPTEIREILDEVFTSSASPTPLVPLGDEFGLRLAAPDADAPVAEEPVAEPPVAEEPAAEPPVAEEPVAEPPVVEEPAPEPPVADEPVPEPPAADEPPAPIELPVFRPEPVEPVEPVPAAEPEPEPEPLPAAIEALPLDEPTIERDEETRVSLAFHATPTPTPAVGEPLVEEPHVEEPLVAEPHVEEPHVEEPHVEEPHVEVPQVPEPAAVEPGPEPEEVPAPVVPATDELTYRIVINLDGGDEIDVAFFASETEAQAAARELVAGIAQDGEWPQVGRRFIPPDRIASVEVRERANFGGSRDRAAWGQAPDS